MNKEALLQAKKKLYDAVSASVQAHDEEETRLCNDPHLPALRAVLAGGQGPAAAGEGQPAAANPRVRLNVGKEELEVDRAVLTAIKGSRLGRVFEQGWDSLLPRDEHDRIFLDLDVEQLRPILVFLKKFAAQDNLPEHPEAKLAKEEAKWGFSGLLEQLGLGALGTVEEARGLGTKQAFLEKKERLEAEALQRQQKEPAAEKVIEAIRAQIALFEQNQPLQADTAKETIAVFEAMMQWDKALSQKRAEAAVMESQLEQEKKFLEHLAGTGVQEEGRREPPRIVSVYLDDWKYLQTFRSTLSLCPKLAEKLPPIQNQEKEDRLDLEYDPASFSWVVQYLRMKSLGLEVPPPEVPAPKHAAFAALVEELGLAEEEALLPKGMTAAQRQALMQQLQTVGVRELRLLYRGTRDQFTAQRFHQLCDNQGRTVTVCRSRQGHVFGGYSDIPWDSSGQHKRSNAAFLFKLGHQQQVAFSRHNVVRRPEHAILGDPTYGPFFGANDMYVALNGTGSAVFNVGVCYDKGPGNVNHLAEGADCPLEEVEVFAAS